MSLPGPRELWNSARAALPAVAQIKLEEFARNELTDEDRAKLAHAGNDLEEQLEMLKDLYFNKVPPGNELIKLRGLDRRGTEGRQSVGTGITNVQSARSVHDIDFRVRPILTDARRQQFTYFLNNPIKHFHALNHHQSLLNIAARLQHTTVPIGDFSER